MSTEPTASPGSAVSTELADAYLPRPQFAERHHVDIDAAPAVVWRALDTVQLQELPVARWLIRVRALIGRLRNGAPPRDLPTPRTMPVLARVDGQQMAHGLVGRWWKFGAEPNRSDVDSPAKFLDFDEPGYAKATFSFAVRTGPAGRTRLVTETRVTTTSAPAYRSMRRYWPLIRPFSGLIRRVLLAAVKREALRATRAR